MSVVIHKNDAVDVFDLIARSPVRANPDAHAILCSSIASSDSLWVAYHEGDVACIMGIHDVGTLISGKCYLWMLHTDLIEQHKFLFIRHSQMWVRELLEHFPEIHGHVMTGNDDGKRWLGWLGATFGHSDGRKQDFVIQRKLHG